MSDKNERNFKGVWIPKEIWLNDELSLQEKVMLVEIDSLDNEQGCYASNTHFAKFLGLSKDRVSKLISGLKEKGFVDVKLKYKKNSKEVERRVIKAIYPIGENAYTLSVETPIPYMRKQLYPIGENNYTPIGENAEESNTIYNNTINNTSNKDVDLFSEYSKDNTELLEALQDFEQMRIKIKKPLTSERAKRMLLTKLDEMGKQDTEFKIKLLDEAILNNWQTIYMPKDGSEPKPQGKGTFQPQRTAEEIRGMSLEELFDNEIKILDKK